MLSYNDDSFDQSKTSRVYWAVMIVQSEKINGHKNSTN